MGTSNWVFEHDKKKEIDDNGVDLTGKEVIWKGTVVKLDPILCIVKSEHKSVLVSFFDFKNVEEDLNMFDLMKVGDILCKYASPKTGQIIIKNFTTKLTLSVTGLEQGKEL